MEYQKFHRVTTPQSTDKPSNISFSTDIAKVYRVRVYIHLNWNNKNRKKKKKEAKDRRAIFFSVISLDSTDHRGGGIHVSRRKIKKGRGEKSGETERIIGKMANAMHRHCERDIMQ